MGRKKPMYLEILNAPRPRMHAMPQWGDADCSPCSSILLPSGVWAALTLTEHVIQILTFRVRLLLQRGLA